jgi:hypothetical protein
MEEQLARLTQLVTDLSAQVATLTARVDVLESAAPVSKGLSSSWLSPNRRSAVAVARSRIGRYVFIFVRVIHCSDTWTQDKHGGHGGCARFAWSVEMAASHYT